MIDFQFLHRHFGKGLFLILSILLGTQSAFSQTIQFPDLIVTSQGDSIRCTIQTIAVDNIRFRQPDSVRGIKNGYIGKNRVAYFAKRHYRTPYVAPKGFKTDSAGRVRVLHGNETGYLRAGCGIAWMLSPVRDGVSALGKEHYRKLRLGISYELELARYFGRYFGIAASLSFYKAQHNQSWEFNHYYTSASVGIRGCFRLPLTPKKGHYLFANPGIAIAFSEGGYKYPKPSSNTSMGLAMIGSVGIVWALLPQVGIYAAATGSSTFGGYHTFDTKINGNTALTRAGAIAGVNLSF